MIPLTTSPIQPARNKLDPSIAGQASTAEKFFLKIAITINICIITTFHMYNIRNIYYFRINLPVNLQVLAFTNRDSLLLKLSLR